MLPENYRHIGKISKIFGHKGEALIITDRVFPKKIEKEKWLFLLIDGLPVPFLVAGFQLRNETSAIIKFEDLNTNEELEEFIGLDVLAEESKTHKNAKPFGNHFEIKGYTVFDSKFGELGIVRSMLNFNDNYLLQVFKEKKEILIPVNENIIVEINNVSKIIIVNTPEGLLDL